MVFVLLFSLAPVCPTIQIKYYNNTKFVKLYWIVTWKFWSKEIVFVVVHLSPMPPLLSLFLSSSLHFLSLPSQFLESKMIFVANNRTVKLRKTRQVLTRFFPKGGPNRALLLNTILFTEHINTQINFHPPPGLEPSSLGAISRWLIPHATASHSFNQVFIRCNKATKCYAILCVASHIVVVQPVDIIGKNTKLWK